MLAIYKFEHKISCIASSGYQYNNQKQEAGFLILTRITRFFLLIVRCEDSVIHQNKEELG